MKNRSSMVLTGLLPFFILSLSLVAPATAQAQQAPSPTSIPDPVMTQEEVNKQLLQRLKELEDQVNQLKAKAAATGSAVSSATTPSAQPSTPPPTPTPAPAPSLLHSRRRRR